MKNLVINLRRNTTVTGLLLDCFRKSQVRIVYTSRGQIKESEGELSDVFWVGNVIRVGTATPDPEWAISLLSAQHGGINRKYLLSVKLLNPCSVSSTIKQLLQCFKAYHATEELTAYFPEVVRALMDIYPNDLEELKEVEAALVKSLNALREHS
jgi:hypothetical protein